MFQNCLFCNLSEKEKVICAEHAFVKFDDFPVSRYHALIIPNRHFENFFDITQEELLQVHQLLKETKEYILKKDITVEGFNIGVNIGLVSGQTIFHLHIHLIPRRKGDLENPRGGVRGIFPHDRDY